MVGSKTSDPKVPATLCSELIHNPSPSTAAIPIVSPSSRGAGAFPAAAISSPA